MNPVWNDGVLFFAEDDTQYYFLTHILKLAETYAQRADETKFVGG